MNRLTERKIGYPSCDKKGNITRVDYIEIKNKALAEEKLCQLEDIEEELGIDSITLFKALKNGIYIKDKERIYFVGSPYLCFAENSERQLEFQLRVGDTWHYIKDYGKTWALTREELENE